MKRVKRKITAVVLGICLTVVSAMSVPVYAGTPDAPIVTVTPNTATSSWTNQSATASFVVPQYTVTAGYCANGSVTVSKSQAPATDTVVVTAVPNTNYELEYVVVNGASIGKAGSFEMPAQDTTVQAHFKQAGEAVFDPGAGVNGNAYYYRFHGDIEGDSRPSDYSLSRIYPASDNTYTLNWSYTRNATNIGGNAYSYVYSNKEIDLSKYKTLYIDVEKVSVYGTTYPRLKLCNFKGTFSNVHTDYDVLTDSNRNIAQVEINRAGRQVYSIDVSNFSGTVKPMILNGSDWYRANTYRHNDSASFKIYRIWLE